MQPTAPHAVYGVYGVYGVTRLSRTALVLSLLLPAVTASASAELARAKYCMNCHGFGGHIVGPSYGDIAARRSGEPNAEMPLAQRIRDGSHGEWGTTVMPANAVSDGEALQLARWILSLRPAH